MPADKQRAQVRVKAASNYTGPVEIETWHHDANSEFSGRFLVDIWSEGDALDLDLELEITPDEARQLAMRLIEDAARAEEYEGTESDHEE